MDYSSLWIFKRRPTGLRTLLQINLLLRPDGPECGLVVLGQLAGEIHDHVLDLVREAVIVQHAAAIARREGVELDWVTAKKSYLTLSP
jgi:hypothetical protein